MPVAVKPPAASQATGIKPAWSCTCSRA